MIIRRFLLLGGGDLVREVAKILVDSSLRSGMQCEIAVYSDLPGAIGPENTRFCTSTSEAVRDFPPLEWQAIGCVGNPRVREAMYRQFCELGYVFGKACHQDATLFAEQIGPGCVIFPGARLAIGCRLAEDVVVNFNATVGHDTMVGAHTIIAPGVQLGGRILCGKRVMFGIGSSVLQQRCIGSDSVISAGASVWTDVPAGGTMVGVPAAVRKVPGRSFAPPASEHGENNQNRQGKTIGG